MENQLAYLNDQERLTAYKAITEGCMHLWSKGKLQEEKLDRLLNSLIDLTEKDPYFLAHLISYANNKLDSKDLKVVLTFLNFLSDADGTPFSLGSAFSKPNLRQISQAVFQNLDPKLALRVLILASRKKKLGRFQEGTHVPRCLKTATKKYLKYREVNSNILKGIKKGGLSNILKKMYKLVRIAPSKEASEILGWQQKKGGKLIKKNLFDFSGLNDLEIANKIRNDRLPPTTVLGALPGKLSPVIACAVLEQATGNQAIILTNMFKDQGLLQDKEVMNLYETKIKTAKTAIDRIDRMNVQLEESVKSVLRTERSDKRKETVGDLGKVFIHVDASPSMFACIEAAKEAGSIIAECVQNPQENFHWGIFHHGGEVLPTPKTFVKEEFHSILYGKRTGNRTDCMALWKHARDIGCDTDIFLTDEEHNGPSIKNAIKACPTQPKCVVIVKFKPGGNSYASEILGREIEAEGIPVAYLKPEALKESALVAEAIRTAMTGPTKVIEDIMAHPLAKLPNWWGSI